MGKLLSDAHTNVTKLLLRLNDKRKDIGQFISDSPSTKELYKFTKHEIERFGGFNFEVHNDVSGSSRLKDVLWS